MPERKDITTRKSWISSDFDNMMYNPYWQDRTNKKWIWERDGFPTAAVRGHYKFEGQKDFREQAIRYMLFMYDKKSPLRRELPDLTDRKKEAAALVGLDLSIQYDYKRAESLFNLGNEVWKEMAFSILKYQASREWAMLVSTEQTMWENEYIIYTETYKKDDDADAKDRVDLQKRKAELLKQNKMLDEMCREYEGIIFSDNDDVKETASRFRSKVTPEEIAKSMFREKN